MQNKTKSKRYTHTRGRELDWTELCFTSTLTQYRLYRRWFLQVKRPNQRYQITKGKSYKGKPRKIKQQNTHTNTK